MPREGLDPWAHDGGRPGLAKDALGLFRCEGDDLGMGARVGIAVEALSEVRRIHHRRDGFDQRPEAREILTRRAYVHSALEASLRRLQTDHVDLYQLHAPDPDTPIAETLGALDECVRSGKAIEIGCSNFTVAQLREAEGAVSGSAARFVSVQNEYSLLRRKAELEVLPECERAGLSFLPYFPLAAGVRTGKYRRGQPPPAGARLSGVKPNEGPLSDDTLAAVERLTEFAQSHDRSTVELAIAWIAAHRPVASVIAGATSVEQVHANVAAADWELGADDLAEIDKLVPPPAGG